MLWRWVWQRAAAVLFGLGAASVAFEVGLHLEPRLLPAAYRDSYPLHGVEFFDAGVLARTPVGGVPLPRRAQPYLGPPPADLVDLGVAPTSARLAEESTAPIRIPADARGFPNERALDRADVVLLGDSFTYGFAATAAVAADGPRDDAASELERAFGASVQNLGMPGAGPHEEAYVLEQLGPSLRPRQVIWFVFGGNDMQDAARSEAALATGARTLLDRQPRRIPLLWLPDLAAWTCERLLQRLPACDGEAADRARPAPHAGVLVRAQGRAAQRVWFHPDYIGRLTIGRDDLRRAPGWAGWSDCASRIAAATHAIGAQLHVVYLPSKCEALWPYVREEQFGALMSLASFGGPTPPREAWPHLHRLVEQNADSFESLVRDRCTELGVPFVSVTPVLRAAFERGELGYLAADTHLSLRGNRLVLAALRQGEIGAAIAAAAEAPRALAVAGAPRH